MIDDHTEEEETPQQTQLELLAGAFKNNSTNLIIILLIYIVATAAGYYYPELVPEGTLEKIKEVEKEFNQNDLMTAFGYFAQVTVSLYLGFLLGIAAAIPPVFLILTSALYMGAIAATNGAAIGTAYPATFPDILETMAMCIATAWGAKLGMAWFRTPRLKEIKNALDEGNMLFLKIVMPMLVAALLWRLLSLLNG